MLKSDDHHLFMILLLSQQFFYRSCHGGKYFSSGKVFKTLRAYPMQPFAHAKTQNTANTGLAHLKRCAYKINVFFPLLGVSPIEEFKSGSCCSQQYFYPLFATEA
jgi:hypothetical protein